MTPLVIAHRGACWDAPENSLEAFELAIDHGADYVEFDVRRRGRELVVCHQPRPPKSAPTLESVLARLAGRVGLAIEIKQHAITVDILAALEAHRVDADSAIVVSFHPKAILETRRRCPGLRTIQHVQRVSISWAAEHAWGVGFSDRRATRRGIGRAQALGLATGVYTVNDPARIRELADLGVTAIFCDRPALMRETLRTAAEAAGCASRS